MARPGRACGFGVWGRSVLSGSAASDGVRTAKIRTVKESDARTQHSGGYEDVDTTSTYNSHGQPLTQQRATNDAGTVCTTTTYANDTAHWILDAVTSVSTVSDACSATPTLPDDLLSGSRTLYDGATTWSATPTLTRGDPTAQQALTGWASGAGTYLTTSRTAYDVVGRAIGVTDAQGHTTTTTYTPATAGPTTAVATKNALNQTSSITLGPGRGQTLTSTGADRPATDATTRGP